MFLEGNKELFLRGYLSQLRPPNKLIRRRSAGYYFAEAASVQHNEKDRGTVLDGRFAFEERRLLKNCGSIDPCNIDEYIKQGGYTLAKEAFSSFGCARTSLEVTEAATLFVIAFDHDPLSLFPDLLIASDPHTILEASLLAAYEIRAKILYLCMGSKVGKERMDKALLQLLEKFPQIENGWGLSVRTIMLPNSIFFENEEVCLNYVLGHTPYPLGDPSERRKLYSEKLRVIRLLPALETFMQKKGMCSKTSPVTLWLNDHPVATFELKYGTTLEAMLKELGLLSSAKAIFNGAPFGNVITDFVSCSEHPAASCCVVTQDQCLGEALLARIKLFEEYSCGKCAICREGLHQLRRFYEDCLCFNTELPSAFWEIAEVLEYIALCDYGKLCARWLHTNRGIIEHSCEEHRVHPSLYHCFNFPGETENEGSN